MKHLLILLLTISLPLIAQDEKDYLDKIQKIEVDEGMYSDKLIRSSWQLAQFYQENRRHREALENFERTVSLIHINKGLYSQEQIPVLENMADSLLALDQLEEAEALYDYAIWILRRNKVIDERQFTALKSRFWEKVVTDAKRK